jgi:membrane-associated phospholipid phosphatase
MIKKSFLFWQPKTDYLRLLSSSQIGRPLLIFLNYIIWIFFFYLSYLLIKTNFEIFWQLLFATFFAEIIERMIKRKIIWRRPMFLRHDVTPPGLVDKWYQTGAFPSGHTIKAAIFFLFLLQYPVFSLPLFLVICSGLLFFRVFVGFHYPVDIIGGIIIGAIIWLPCHLIYIFSSLNTYLQIIFNTLFFIK